MSLETMAFLLGGVLIAAGLFGGGLEIKELKLPHIGGAARVIAVFVGIAFIALALAINLKWIQPSDGSEQAKTIDSSKTFQAPMHGGLRLDVCYEWAKRCGEEAATAWCRAQGYAWATTYPVENVGERGVSTKLIGTNDVCQEKFCASFTQITCSK